MNRLSEDSPAKQAYKKVTEKRTKKTKGGQDIDLNYQRPI